LSNAKHWVPTTAVFTCMLLLACGRWCLHDLHTSAWDCTWVPSITICTVPDLADDALHLKWMLQWCDRYVSFFEHHFTSIYSSMNVWMSDTHLIWRQILPPLSSVGGCPQPQLCIRRTNGSITTTYPIQTTCRKYSFVEVRSFVDNGKHLSTWVIKPVVCNWGVLIRTSMKWTLVHDKDNWMITWWK
jgi:hypothetical protein